MRPALEIVDAERLSEQRRRRPAQCDTIGFQPGTLLVRETQADQLHVERDQAFQRTRLQTRRRIGDLALQQRQDLPLAEAGLRQAERRGQQHDHDREEPEKDVCRAAHQKDCPMLT